MCGPFFLGPKTGATDGRLQRALRQALLIDLKRCGRRMLAATGR